MVTLYKKVLFVNISAANMTMSNVFILLHYLDLLFVCLFVCLLVKRLLSDTTFYFKTISKCLN